MRFNISRFIRRLIELSRSRKQKVERAKSDEALEQEAREVGTEGERSRTNRRREKEKQEEAEQETGKRARAAGAQGGRKAATNACYISMVKCERTGPAPVQGDRSKNKGYTVVVVSFRALSLSPDTPLQLFVLRGTGVRAHVQACLHDCPPVRVWCARVPNFRLIRLCKVGYNQEYKGTRPT